MNQPQPSAYPEWAEKYISLVEGDVLDVLERQASEIPEFVNSLTDKADFAYAPGKWTIKQLIGHMIDTERILVYRILCFARESRPLCLALMKMLTWIPHTFPTAACIALRKNLCCCVNQTSFYSIPLRKRSWAAEE